MRGESEKNKEFNLGEGGRNTEAELVCGGTRQCQTPIRRNHKGPEELSRPRKGLAFHVQKGPRLATNEGGMREKEGDMRQKNSETLPWISGQR